LELKIFEVKNVKKEVVKTFTLRHENVFFGAVVSPGGAALPRRDSAST